MSLIHNERTKLAATYLNGVAIACVAIGGLAPMVSIIVSGSATPTGRLLILAIGCLVISIALHWSARRVLRRLTE